MARQLLPHDVTPEDRARGCFWASTFRRAGDEVQKLGTINGTPTINRGVTLNGTTDYINYALWGQFDTVAQLSFHVVFYPDFAANANAIYRPFTSYNGAAIAAPNVLKRDNAGGNDLRVSVGATSLDVPYATYSPLWVVGGRNLLSAFLTSGSNVIYFNGSQVLTSGNLWTPVVVTEFVIGSTRSGGNYFDGKIESLKFYGTYLQTALDHQAIWAGGGA